jgi:(2Fe-2S) ferredoxin
MTDMNPTTPPPESVLRPCRIFGIGSYARHILICTGPSCCSTECGMESWEYLKRRLSELNLVAPKGNVYRTKVGCLRVCAEGPIAVVYPEGTWYWGMTPDRLERVIVEHLAQGRVVDEFAFARNPLKPE